MNNGTTIRELSSVGSERLPYKQRVGGSTPSAPTGKDDYSVILFSAQRKIPVDLHFIVRLRHKASGAALGLSCAVCFEQPAGVFAGCGAVCQAKILASLKIKNGISLTPLN